MYKQFPRKQVADSPADDIFAARQPIFIRVGRVCLWLLYCTSLKIDVLCLTYKCGMRLETVNHGLPPKINNADIAGNCLRSGAAAAANLRWEVDESSLRPQSDLRLRQALEAACDQLERRPRTQDARKSRD